MIDLNDSRIPLRNNMVVGKSRYLITEILNYGGMSIIYSAIDLWNGKKCVVKEYYSNAVGEYRREDERELNYSDELIYQRKKELFDNEVMILKSVKDMDNCIHMLDFFCENYTFYIVTDYIEGESLESKMLHGNLSIEKSVWIYKQLLWMIGELHQRKIVHRDICPDNIILDKKTKIKLIDFGSAINREFDNNSIIIEPTYRREYSPVEYTEGECVDEYWPDIYSATVIFSKCLGACCI